MVVVLIFGDPCLGRSETTPSRVCPFGAVLPLVAIIRALE